MLTCAATSGVENKHRIESGEVECGYTRVHPGGEAGVAAEVYHLY
jgi:hypothetical protein